MRRVCRDQSRTHTLLSDRSRLRWWDVTRFKWICATAKRRCGTCCFYIRPWSFFPFSVKLWKRCELTQPGTRPAGPHHGPHAWGRVVRGVTVQLKGEEIWCVRGCLIQSSSDTNTPSTNNQSKCLPALPPHILRLLCMFATFASFFWPVSSSSHSSFFLFFIFLPVFSTASSPDQIIWSPMLP